MSEIPPQSILEHLLEEVHQLRVILNGRLGNLENNVCFLNKTCNNVADKVNSLETMVQTTCRYIQSESKKIESRTDFDGSCSNGKGVLATQNAVLPLLDVDDYPSGSWLGDPDNPSKRVRCPITPQNLLHINSTCVTAEKMALTLLDYLFSREELASSNISGKSRNNKKQLDPMMIYGIRCHLQYKFNINSKEWHRISQNMDSKCRSAWKRRLKLLDSEQINSMESNSINQLTNSLNESNSSGLNITHANKIIKICPVSMKNKEASLPDDMCFNFDTLQPSNLDLNCVKVMTDSQCEFRILHSSNSSHGNMNPLPGTHEMDVTQDRILHSNDATSPTEDESLLMHASNVNSNRANKYSMSISHLQSSNPHNEKSSSPSLRQMPLLRVHSNGADDPSRQEEIIEDPLEGVIVINEICEMDTALSMNLSADDNESSESPSPPSLNLQHHTDSESHHSHMGKHGGIDYGDSIHTQSPLHHLTITNLDTLRGKESPTHQSGFSEC